MAQSVSLKELVFVLKNIIFFSDIVGDEPYTAGEPCTKCPVNDTCYNDVLCANQKRYEGHANKSGIASWISNNIGATIGIILAALGVMSTILGWSSKLVESKDF